jgi:hypothetical protein
VLPPPPHPAEIRSASKDNGKRKEFNFPPWSILICRMRLSEFISSSFSTSITPSGLKLKKLWARTSPDRAFYAFSTDKVVRKR